MSEATMPGAIDSRLSPSMPEARIQGALDYRRSPSSMSRSFTGSLSGEEEDEAEPKAGNSGSARSFGNFGDGDDTIPHHALQFDWMTPLMKVAYKKPITEKDVWKLDTWDQTETLYREYAPATRWRCLNQLHWVLVLSLMIVHWMVEPSLAYPMSNSDFSRLETRTLRLGQERIEEKLPFRGNGKCIYELMDMKKAHWYEVKISYPASTPAVFSIDLLPEHDEDSTSSGRKLLNTEKIIFHLPEGPASQDVQDGINRRVLVSVRPEGFVAQPYVQEQPVIPYNILLEEVHLGVPLQAFWVGFLGLVALCASALAARQMTIHLQPLVQQLATKSTKRAS